MATIKPQSNGPFYSNAVIGTLAVDGWAVTFGMCEEGPGRAGAPPNPLLAVPNVMAHLSTASVPKSYYYVAHYVWPYHETVRMSVRLSVCLSVCHVSYLENGAR